MILNVDDFHDLEVRAGRFRKRPLPSAGARPERTGGACCLDSLMT